MGTSLDCQILRNVFGSERMRHVFDTRQLLQGWFEVWASLAEAEADVGLIPREAASRIRHATRSDEFDVERIGEEVRTGRHFLMPAINALTAASGDAGRYVHWGATTQDITDTGMVLQLRNALDIVEPSLQRLITILAGHVESSGHHPMAGRTHWQHAVPITLGFKFALWIDELARHEARIRHCRELISVAELHGAGGTLASLGADGLRVRAAFCKRLGLAEPDIAWHGSRDRLTELVSTIGMIAATLEKICLEVGRLSGNDIGELHEPRRKRQVGSSTMPQKHNPILCERSVAGCRIVRGMVPVMQGLMVGCHERDLASVSGEWLLIPQCLITFDGSLQYTETILAGLQIFPDKMLENLQITGGGIVSEAVMFGLAAQMGRTQAHDVMVEVARAASEQKRPLLELLLEREDVTAALTREELLALVKPENHLGLARELTDAVISRRADAG
ncbi:adenylosuccinate lyase [Aquamicrobium sp. LC103]|uniref:adenylosuccinate lyase n=1 Tax=Aquamicrobium sp. LC103 TaxID=1120658 RepID=UPI00063E9B4E|nr:adenylosuccinate lyase [Aquamicrobium sp. LC103]TKT69800.1 adenylosuccinate lyase [Aquamicrobium sp. LC103]